LEPSAVAVARQVAADPVLALVRVVVALEPAAVAALELRLANQLVPVAPVDR
jgi:hypothetical protein